jgi:hypothetical protein
MEQEQLVPILPVLLASKKLDLVVLATPPRFFLMARQERLSLVTEPMVGYPERAK